jgi:hypothetical protein
LVEKFGVTKEELKKAVAKVGTSAEAVESILALVIRMELPKILSLSTGPDPSSLTRPGKSISV